jgi:hypothetical protein
MHCGCELAWNFNGKLPQSSWLPMEAIAGAGWSDARKAKYQCDMEYNCCVWKDASVQGGTAGGCTCRDVWGVEDETCNDGKAAYRGCGMDRPCDGAARTWCLLDPVTSAGCNAAGDNWDYCDAGRPSCVPKPNTLSTNTELLDALLGRGATSAAAMASPRPGSIVVAVTLVWATLLTSWAAASN